MESGHCGHTAADAAHDAHRPDIADETAERLGHASTESEKTDEEWLDEWVYRHQRKRMYASHADLETVFRRYSRWCEHRIAPHLPQDRDAIIWDMPCGEGQFLYFLTSRGYTNASGMDLDAERIDTAREFGLAARVGDCVACLAASEGATVDCIIAMDFLEHLTKAGAVRYLQQVRRVLRPGGILIVRMPSADGPLGARDWCNDLTHKWAATSGALQRLLTAVGFDGVEVFDERPAPYNLVNSVRLGVLTVTRALVGLLLVALDLTVPDVWTTSMWAVGHK